ILSSSLFVAIKLNLCSPSIDAPAIIWSYFVLKGGGKMSTVMSAGRHRFVAASLKKGLFIPSNNALIINIRQAVIMYQLLSRRYFFRSDAITRCSGLGEAIGHHILTAKINSNMR